jgi:hypothetical protein
MLKYSRKQSSEQDDGRGEKPKSSGKGRTGKGRTNTSKASPKGAHKGAPTRRELLAVRPVRNPVLEWVEEDGQVVLHIKRVNNWKTRLITIFTQVPESRRVVLDPIGTHVWRMLEKGALMATMSMGPAKIDRQISLPFSQAFKIALRNITIRLGRAMITGAGTMLGIAFLMSVFAAHLASVAARDVISPGQMQKQSWLVAMSLMVSVVGITNSMLMSVTERYKEIGTMKCLGALDNFIVRLFLLESGILGGLGSLVGALIGSLFILLTNIGVWGNLDWGKLLLSILGCVTVGSILSIIAAVGPAIRASRMPPADAMRSEI